MSPLLARVIGVKFTVAAGLAAIAGGLWQISAASAAATTYGDVVPGLLLIGLGAGLLLPTATNSVVGSVPQGDSGIGSATNAVALQVGGALGVAVIGSVLSTRYQDHMTTALAGRHLPAAATQPSSARSAVPSPSPLSAGGATGALLAHAARAAFMSGNEMALAVGAVVALGGVVLVLARLPLRVSRDSPDPQRRTASTGQSPNAHATAAIKKDAASREKPDAAVHVRARQGLTRWSPSADTRKRPWPRGSRASRHAPPARADRHSIAAEMQQALRIIRADR